MPEQPKLTGRAKVAAWLAGVDGTWDGVTKAKAEGSWPLKLTQGLELDPGDLTLDDLREMLTECHDPVCGRCGLDLTCSRCS